MSDDADKSTQSIMKLGLSFSSFRALDRAGVRSVGDLLRQMESRFSGVPGLSDANIAEIRAAAGQIANKANKEQTDSQRQLLRDSEQSSGSTALAGLSVLDMLRDILGDDKLDLARARALVPESIGMEDADAIRIAACELLREYYRNPGLSVVWCLAELSGDQIDEQGTLSLFREAIRLYKQPQKATISTDASNLLLLCAERARTRGCLALSERMAIDMIHVVEDASLRRDLMRASPTRAKAAIAWAMLAALSARLGELLDNKG